VAQVSHLVFCGLPVPISGSRDLKDFCLLLACESSGAGRQWKPATGAAEWNRPQFILQLLYYIVLALTKTLNRKQQINP
jgi:hypothetical protein